MSAKFFQFKKNLFITILLLVIFVLPNNALAENLLTVGSANSNLTGTDSAIFSNIGSISATTTSLIRLQKNGVDLFKVDSTGNVTMGNFLTSISAANVSSGAFGSLSGNGNYSFPGNVGIGTMTPAARLNIYSTSSIEEMFRLSDASGSSAANKYINWYSNNGGTTLTDFARIGAGYGSDYINSFMAFSVADGARVLRERVRINVNGNVGIGTTNPQQKLHIYGATAPGFYLTNSASGETPSDGYIFQLNGADTFMGNRENGALYLYTANSLAKGLTILNTGNVGIGTTTPQVTLDVNGLIKMRSSQITTTSDVINKGYLDSALETLSSSTNALNYWAANGTNIYNKNTGNVGIGTTAPANKLDVALGSISIGSSNISNGLQSSLKIYSFDNGAQQLGTLAADYADSLRTVHLFGNSNTNQIKIDTSASNGRIILFPGTGNVGIGTTNPITPLNVIGKWQYNLAGTIYSQDNSFSLDLAGINVDSLKVYKDLYSTTGVLKTDGTGDNWLLGNVGIGITNPGAKLDVFGSFRLSNLASSTSFTGLAISPNGDVGKISLSKSAVKEEAVYNVATTAYQTFMSSPSYVDNYHAKLRITTYATDSLISGNVMVVEVYGSKNYVPTVSVVATQNSTGSSASGIQYFRVAYPSALNNGAPVHLEFNTASTANRYIKVEVLDSENLNLLPAVNGSLYTSSNQSVNTPLVYYNGTVTNKTIYGSVSGSAGSSAYSTYGSYAGFSASNGTDKTGLWAYIGEIYLAYSSTYRFGQSWNIELKIKENANNTSKPVNLFDDAQLILKGRMPVSTDANAFNTTIPEFSVELNGNNLELTKDDIAMMVASSNTSAKSVRLYVRLKSANTNYVFTPINRYGASYSSTGVISTGYCYFNSVTGAVGPLPSPASGQGSIVYAVQGENSNFWRSNNDNIFNLNTGNVGIGTTSPQVTLDVNGLIKMRASNITTTSDVINKGYLDSALETLSSSTNALNYWAANGTNIYNKNTGNVGIGTTNPQKNLDLSGDNNIIRITDTKSLSAGGWLNQQLGGLEFFTSDTSGIGAHVGASIRAFSVGGASYLTPDYSLIFSTGAYNAVELERMRINNFGNVGIGTTNPAGKLDVSAGLASQTAGDLVVDTAAKTVYVGNLDSNSGNTTFIFRDRLANQKMKLFNAGSGSFFMGNFGNNYGLQIQSGSLNSISASATITARLVVDSGSSSFPAANFLSGNVGIGTTTPNQKLEVSGGNIFITDASINSGTPHAAITKTYLDSALETYGSKWILNGSKLYASSTDWNVGIGTVNPSQKFVVDGGNNTNPTILIQSRTDVPNTSIGTFAVRNSANSQITGSIEFKAHPTLVNPWDYSSILFNTWNGYNTLSPKMIIKYDGSVGIGTTTPQVTLDVNGLIKMRASNITTTSDVINKGYLDSALENLTASTTALNYWAANGTNIYNKNTGNVGIGTSSPSQKLTVVSGSPAAPYSGIGLFSGGSSSYTAYTVGRTSVDGYFGVSGGANHYLNGSVAGDVIIDSVSGKVLIGTGSIVGTVGLAVNAGNVGIGTTTPDAKLNVYGNAGIVVEHPSAGGSSRPALIHRTGGIERWKFSTISTDDFAIDVNAAERLRIQSDGNVGIGTTTPNQKLEVSGGNIFITDASINSGTPHAAITKTYLDSALETYGSKWILNGSKLYASSTDWNVGIGTTNPTYKLQVAQNSNLGALFDHTGSSSGDIGTNGGFVVINGYSNTVPTLAVHNAGTGPSAYFTGNVGIGTNNPGARLETFGQDVSFYSGAGTQNLNVGRNATEKVNIFVQDQYGYFNYVQDESDTSSHNFEFNIQSASTGSADWIFKSRGLETIRFKSGGNVGIGTTTPNQKLEVSGGNIFITDASINSGTPHAAITKTYLDSALETYGSKWILNGSKLYASSTDWNVGIGTTNPGAKLNVDGDVLIGGTSLNYGSQYRLQVTAVDKGIYIRMPGLPANANSNNAFGIGIAGETYTRGLFYSNGTYGIGSGSAVRDIFIGRSAANTIRIGSEYDLTGLANLIINGNVGIGTTTPSASLDIFGNFKITSGGLVYNTNSSYRFNFSDIFDDHNSLIAQGDINTAGVLETTGTARPNYMLGKLGVGTSAPNAAYKLDVAGKINTSGGDAGGFCLSGDCIDSWGDVVGTFNSSTPLTIGNLTVSNIVMDQTGGFGNILNVRKLTVGTIDPLYRIDGTNYSSFAAAIVGGVKEEYLGRVKISELNKNKEYEYRLDFSKLSAPDELWVWRQTVDFSPENVEVNLTPYGAFARIYYIIEDEAIIFRADKPITVSYRLSGKRVDWQNWPTKAKDQQEKPSFIINKGKVIK